MKKQFSKQKTKLKENDKKIRKAGRDGDREVEGGAL